MFSPRSAGDVAGVAAARVGLPLGNRAVLVADDVLDAGVLGHVTASGGGLVLGVVGAGRTLVAFDLVLPLVVLVIGLDVTLHGEPLLHAADLIVGSWLPRKTRVHTTVIEAGCGKAGRPDGGR